VVGVIAPARLAILIVSAVLASGGAALSGGFLPTSEPANGGTDYGLDTDADGAYDWLIVNASVVLPEAGTWDISAQLMAPEPPSAGPCSAPFAPMPLMEATSPQEWPIAWAYERYFFEAGSVVIRIAFPGTDIYRAGVDGPYGVYAYLSLGDGVMRLMPWPGPVGSTVEWNYTTRPYRFTDFDEPYRPAYFTGTHAEEPIDVDSDGAWDLFELTADVHVDTAGNYSLNGELFLRQGSDWERWYVSIGYAYRDAYLEAGDGSVYLRFRGDQIRAAGIDGPWNFSMTLYGPNYYYWQNGTVPGGPEFAPMPYPEILCGTTAAYPSASFDDTVELLRYTGTFGETAIDWNGNGLYDALVIRAEVEAYVSAAFDHQGILRNGDGTKSITTSWNTAWLPEGIGWVEFVFSGPDIRASGLDGPYLANLSITPSAGGIDPMTNYTTRAYEATDFEEGPAQGRPYWIERLEAAAASPTMLSILVDIVRGGDLLTVVYEDVLTTTVYDASGKVVWSVTDRVYLPTGNSSQSFAYRVDGLAPGTYRIVALLGPPERPVDERSVEVTL